MTFRRTEQTGRNREPGFTLIEVLVVVLVVGLLFMGVVFGMGAVRRTELRSAAVKIAAAARWAYAHASTSDETVRLVLGVGGGTLALQTTQGRFLLAREDGQQDDDEREESEDDTTAFGRLRLSGRAVIAPQFRAAGGQTFAAWNLPSGVRIARLYVSHQYENPREAGRGYVYFFPGGLAEHAVVQIQDRDGIIHSVEIHPLSARATVVAEPVEPEMGELGADTQEARDDL